jgi:hypothetical protein
MPISLLLYPWKNMPNAQALFKPGSSWTAAYNKSNFIDGQRRNAYLQIWGNCQRGGTNRKARSAIELLVKDRNAWNAGELEMLRD